MKWSIHRSWCAVVLLVCVTVGCGGGNGGDSAGRPAASGQAADGCSRIVSLAPSITETLYALGLGDRVAGVTRFCTFPPGVVEKPSVGGYLDPNYEMMAALEPDCVLLLPEHEEVRTYLDRLGIRHETVHNRTVGEIMATIEAIGRLCGAEQRADSLLADIERRMDAVRRNTPPDERPEVLVSVGRTLGTGSLREVYVAGPGTYYDELIVMAGGENACPGGRIAYPLLSAEGLLQCNPDIIIDLVPRLGTDGHDRGDILDEWRSVGSLKAVRESSVYLLSGGYTTVPGPRFILLLEDMAEIIRSAGDGQ